MTSQDEAERIRQSNAIAGIVIDVAATTLPELFAPLDFRYGIADALWDLGYRKVEHADTKSDYVLRGSK